jgi:hypothetical protein
MTYVHRQTLTANAAGAIAAGKTDRLRHNKGSTHVERVADARKRHVELMTRAENAGSHRNDPIWKKFVAGHYGKQPLVWSQVPSATAVVGNPYSDIVIGGRVDAEGCRVAGDNFRVVGKIQFAPGGGLLGVIVYDKNDCTAFCEGTLADAAGEWSWITRDFSLLNLNAAGLSPEAVKADAEAKAKADEVRHG